MPRLVLRWVVASLAMLLLVPLASAAEWVPVRVPGFWESVPQLRGYNGFAWYRCFVSVPKAWQGQALRLDLGGIDDADETFFNGTRVGATGSMPPKYDGQAGAQRRYTVPAQTCQNTCRVQWL